jgi:hypothetical protein
VETGRTQPSRAVVLHLADHLGHYVFLGALQMAPSSGNQQLFRYLQRSSRISFGKCDLLPQSTLLPV